MRTQGTFVKRALLLASIFALSSCNANSPENKYLLAEKLLEDRKYDAAISEFQDIVDKSPSSKLGFDAQLKIAQIQHLYLGKYSEALVSYNEALKNTKQVAQAIEIEKTIGDLYFQNLEQYEEAIKIFQKLIGQEKDPANRNELTYKMGRALFLKGEFTKAKEIYESLNTSDAHSPTYTKAILELGNVLSTKGNCKEAIKHFESVKNSQFREIAVLAKFGMASCMEELGDLDGAYDIFSQIRDYYPSPSVIKLKMSKIKKRKILRKR